MDVSGRELMLAGLLDASRGVSMEQLPDLVTKCAARAGIRDVLIYVSDLDQHALRLLTGLGGDAAQGSGTDVAAIPIDDSIAGEAFQHAREVRDDTADGVQRWWLPLLNGNERLGVLRVGAEDTDPHTRQSMRDVAAMVALLIVSRHGLSDSYARLVRGRPINVAAEMQRHLLPPHAFTNEAVTIGGIFEPAHAIAGDSFDYALAGDTVHLAIFDAMGHNMTSGLTANLAVAACRNRRRQGTGLGELGYEIERELVKQFNHYQYVTAILADLHLESGVLDWVSHGHLPPVIIRGDRRITLDYTPGHPLGTELGVSAVACQAQLRPGDYVLFYTDGVTEARSHPADPETAFGLDRFLDLLTAHLADRLSVPELLRRVIRSVSAYPPGELEDDATILLMEWRGGSYHEPPV